MAATSLSGMHTVMPLFFGALTGWLAALCVRAGEEVHIASYIAMGVAGASIGSWLVDASAVVYGREEEVYPGLRLTFSFLGSSLLITGFRSIW